jgi:tetratricopeptide (TPR) repeat protein
MLSGRQFTIIATNALYTSEYANTRAWMDVVRTRAERLSNVQQLGWSGNVVSVADLHQGRYAQAIEGAERSREIFLQERDLISLIISEGVRCAALCHSGRMAEALEGADRALQLIEGARPTTWGQLEGFAGPCEVYACALAQGLLPFEALKSRLRTALLGLRLFAWVFPFGRARYRFIAGLLAQARGRPAAARRHLTQALVHARRYRMPYEELRAAERLAMLAAHGERAQLDRHASALKVQVETGASMSQLEVQAV